MQSEYLIYNLIILAGPVSLSFDRRVHFIGLWPKAVLASLITLVPFIIWDIAVTGRHWWFNEMYTMPVRFLGLPPAEWLFFISVPFACIFIWEVLKAYFSNRIFRSMQAIYLFSFPFYIGSVILYYYGLEYTGLVAFALATTLVLDKFLAVRILSMSRSLIQLAIVTGLILIFNGYLTARPVVLYDAEFQLDFRITTIPVEDFFYGYSHVFLSIIAFEWLLGRKRG